MDSSNPTAGHKMLGQRPRLLDLFCCAGGAAMGYHRAGFDVVGVDIAPQPNYPFEFVQGDALEVLRSLTRGVAPLAFFDAIHASPPCQHYSDLARRNGNADDWPDLVDATRDALQATGLPWVIENVEGAALINPVWLCGTEFGLTAVDVDDTPLELWRHRGFESNIPLEGAGGCQHYKYSKVVAGVYAGGNRKKDRARGTGYVPNKAVQSKLMGITWMSERELHQAIPPVYAEHVGKQLINAMALNPV